MATHYLDSSAPHSVWDRDIPPRLTIEPGDEVIFETLEGTGQIGPHSDSNSLRNMRRELIHALTGPVAIAGAQPGHTLVVEVLLLEHHGWGWNGVLPGLGLLADDFPHPYIHHYALEGDVCYFSDDIRIPYEPFCGTMGVALEERGRFDTIPPRRNGGNIDIRHLTQGAIVRLPVLVPGALFSCGDCHAAQGDGEINGTGIETPMTVHLRFDLETNRPVHELQFTTPAGVPLTRAGEGGYFATTAHGPDLFVNAQNAVRQMIEVLVVETGLTREQAYCLCGAVLDLKISQIVDAPNWIVSAYFPLSLFDGD